MQHDYQEEAKGEPGWQGVATELLQPGSNAVKTISAKDLVGVMRSKKDVYNILSREGN